MILVLILSINGFAQDFTPISAIQGEIYMSPLAGKSVTTRGIVTGIVRRGFYIQTPDAEVDANPKTSEGIYVFTRDEPQGVAIGQLVEVRGNVLEFVPPRERYFLPLTEITEPTFKVISKDNPLPAPITLTSVQLSPTGQIDQMERYEGMRVRIEALTVVSPTGGFVNDKTGNASSDGTFFGVIEGTPRPFREAGVEALTFLIDKLPQTIPVFDMNPELIRIDSNAQTGRFPIDVTAGATLKNINGIMDYSRRSYTLLVEAATSPVVEGNRTFVPVSAAKDREVTIGAFNIENFFDDEKNSPNVDKEEVVPTQVFQKRLAKASLAIRKGLSNPDVLGIVEVENLIALKRLAEKINTDSVAEGAPDPKYVAYLEEGNDIRGIDSGYLVKSSKVKVIETKQISADEKLETPGANPNEKSFDRPPFLITVEVPDPNGPTPFRVTAIVNHFKSYGGIDDPKDGDRVRNKRRIQAEKLAKYVEERALANPEERLLVMGDLNAFQFNDGYNDLVGTLRGTPDQNVMVPSRTAFKTGLTNLAELIDPVNRYSYVFGGSAQILDHILANRPARMRALKFGYARLNADFPAVYRNDITRPERLSDHDAPIFFMSMDERKPAPKP
jgi:predicted extracellular nuclease